MKATFKLRVLTPLFMGGADPEGKPELRAASIRGAMRFWLTVIINRNNEGCGSFKTWDMDL